MTFQEVCSYCIGNREFVKQFNRLSGHHLGEPRTAIERMVDEACGRDPDMEAMPEFVNLVYEVIWKPLVMRDSA